MIKILVPYHPVGRTCSHKGSDVCPECSWNREYTPKLELRYNTEGFPLNPYESR